MHSIRTSLDLQQIADSPVVLVRPPAFVLSAPAAQALAWATRSVRALHQADRPAPAALNPKGYRRLLAAECDEALGELARHGLQLALTARDRFVAGGAGGDELLMVALTPARLQRPAA